MSNETVSSEGAFRPRCPTCSMMSDPEKAAKFLPFCSLRCRMIDLGRWLNEEHTLPCSAGEDEESDSPSSGGVKLPPGWHDE